MTAHFTTPPQHFCKNSTKDWAIIIQDIIVDTVKSWVYSRCNRGFTMALIHDHLFECPQTRINTGIGHPRYRGRRTNTGLVKIRMPQRLGNQGFRPKEVVIFSSMGQTLMLKPQKASWPYGKAIVDDAMSLQISFPSWSKGAAVSGLRYVELLYHLLHGCTLRTQ